MGKTRFDFSGQVVAITGAGKGIGKGAAIAFAEAGARVFAIDHTPVTGETTVKAIRDAGGQAAFIACDVSDAGSVSAAFQRIERDAGRLDVLVKSAGGFSKQMATDETPEDEWDRVIDVNLKGVFLCAQAAIPLFKRQRSGRIVNLGSMAGLTTMAPETTASERVVALRSPEQRDAIGKATLVGRIAEVSDMVGWVLFLAAPEASYLTGQTLAVNGGRLMV
ncbi:MAG: SDR family oxidoreductase [Candidatus Rokubacteria bacterium]|nr:SDR family oxidoreductase [Candidatus Rokubacteria bacterium]